MKEHSMLKITNSAWNRLAKISSDRPTVDAIRLKFAKGEFKCCAGKRREQDRTIENDGRPTLLLSPAVAKHLSRRVLDAAETKRGLRLRLRPKQKRGTVAKGN